MCVCVMCEMGGSTWVCYQDRLKGRALQLYNLTTNHHLWPSTFSIANQHTGHTRSEEILSTEGSRLYLVHLELAHIRITSDRKEVWARDLHHSTAFVEAAKSLVVSNVIGHG